MNTRTDIAHEAQQRCPTLSGVEEENESKGRMRIYASGSGPRRRSASWTSPGAATSP